MRTPFSRGLVGVVAATAILASVVAGCGGSSSTSEALSDAATQAQATDTAGGSGAAGLKGFVTDIGAELNDFWQQNIGDANAWAKARVKVPENAASTACGVIDADNTGPAYCDQDHTLVLPLAFLRGQFVGASDTGTNDAAVAAVIAHEFGHHVQALVGVSDEAAKAQADNPELANLISVADELHADCLMGLWLSSVNNDGRLEVGDINEVLTTLDKIGDDKLSAGSGQAADASTFDHGTSAERSKWFEVGYTTGDAQKCVKVYDDLGDGTLQAELQAGADAVNGATDTTDTTGTTG